MEQKKVLISGRFKIHGDQIGENKDSSKSKEESMNVVLNQI